MSHTTAEPQDKKAPSVTKSARGGAAGDKVFSGLALVAGAIILLVLAFVAIFLVVESLPALWPKVFSSQDSIVSADNFFQYVWPLMAGNAHRIGNCTSYCYPDRGGSRSLHFALRTS